MPCYLGEYATQQPVGLPSKDELERQKIQKELKLFWRILQGIGLVTPGLAFILAVVSAMYAYQQNQNDNFRKILGDLGEKEVHTRVAAVSRLSAYSWHRSGIGSFLNWAFGGLSVEQIKAQVIRSATAILRLEEDIHVKKEILHLLGGLGPDSRDALRQVRIDLISTLKLEGPERPNTYWRNLRETLFHVALALAELSKGPPDFRCFPLRGIKLRQAVLPDGSSFEGATLAQAELWGGRIRQATFRDANLFQAVIRDIDLQGTTFDGAELAGASFGPNLANLNLDGFRDSNWRQVKSLVPAAIRADLARRFPGREGSELKGRDRDVFCSKVLNEDFRVE